MAANRLSELVRTVKQWTFHDQGERHDVDLVTVVEDSLTLLRHKAGNTRVRRSLPESAWVAGRGGELGQVVTNLLDNAFDAARTEVMVSIIEGPDEVSVIVCDDGPGVPPEVEARIWEPFFTTKPPGKGTGLGLALSQRIASDHGGSLVLQSQPGDTRFELRIPKPQ